MTSKEIGTEIRKAKRPATTARWIRPPRTRERCEFSGLTRPYVYQLIAAGAIKSRVLRQPGKMTGVRLIWLPSLMEYIERNGEETTPSGAGA